MSGIKSTGKIPTRNEKIAALRASAAKLRGSGAEITKEMFARHAVRDLPITYTTMQSFMVNDLSAEERRQNGIPEWKPGRGGIVWPEKLEASNE
jgi:hypothetical protein